METIKELRNKAQGERIKNNPWYGQLVMRRISIYMTWMLLTHIFRLLDEEDKRLIKSFHPQFYWVAKYL